MVAHSTPFGRITGSPVQAPVAGLFLLTKDREFFIEPLKPADMLKYLWDEHQYYTRLYPLPLRQRAFDLFYQLAHQSPCFRLHFPRDFVDWAAIERVGSH